MANTIIRVETSNTFDQWRIVTNTLVDAANELRKNTYAKDSGGMAFANGSITVSNGNIQIVNGTLQIDRTFGETIYAAADVRFGGKMTASNVISSNLFITGRSNFSNTITVSVNNDLDAVRITQTGNGRAFVVEDETNPDGTPFVIDAGGNVGIGTTATSFAKLATRRDSSRPDNEYGIYSTFRSSATSGSNNKFAIQGDVGTSAGYAATSVLTGISGIASHETTGTINQLRGISSYIQSIGSGTITNAYQFLAQEAGLGAGGSNAITNLVGYWAGDMSAGTNDYGFYGNLSAGANKWNYYAGGTANNYFNGSVGVGIATPTSKLHVVGDANVTASITVSGMNVTQTITNAFTQANSAFAQANVGYTQANLAFAQANVGSLAFTQANLAFAQANVANSIAISAYTQANLAFAQANVGSLAFTQANIAYTQANLAFSQANSANSLANSAYIQANLAFAQANIASAAFTRANIAYTQANLAFAQANVANSIAISAYTQANLAFAQGNSAFTQGSTGYTQANLAFDRANTGYTQANLAFAQGNSAFTQASTGYTQANLAFAQANTAKTQADIGSNTVAVSVGGLNQLVNKQLNFNNTANILVSLSLGSGSNANISFDFPSPIAKMTITDLSVGTLNYGTLTGPTESATDSYRLRVGLTTRGDGSFGVNQGGANGNAQIYFSATDNLWKATSNNLSGLYYNIITTQNVIDSVTSTSVNDAASPNSVRVTYNQATGAHNQANLARTQANTGYTQANLAFAQANSGYTQANLAYAQANAAFGAASRSQVSANSGPIIANVNINFNNTSTVSVTVKDGSVGNADISFAVIPNFSTQIVAGGGASFTAGQTVSFNNTATAPFTVASTTKVTSLNADLLDGYDVGTTGSAIPLMSGTNLWTGQQSFNTSPIMRASTSTEGGEIILQKPSSSTLAADIYIDSQSNAFRVFEGGGSARGMQIDLTTLPAGLHTIWTSGNDGSGSGLDADTLDGLNSSAFMYANTTTFSADSTARANIIQRVESGFYEYSLANTELGWPVNSNSWQHLIAVTHSNDTNYYSMQLAGSFYNSDLYQRTTAGSGTTAWNKIWTSGNDGAGSTLDADLLDGVQGSSFVRNDVGSQEVQSYFTINNSGGYAVLEFEDAANVQRTHAFHDSTQNLFGIGVFDSSGANRKDLYLYQSGAITWTGNTVWHAGNDGVGSGLDADLFDGYNIDSFLIGNGNATTTANFPVGTYIGFNTYYDGVDARWEAKNTSNGAFAFRNSGDGLGFQFLIQDGPVTAGASPTFNNYYLRDGDFFSEGNKFWHAGNDGAGSTLDADTVDSLQASQFLRSDAGTTWDGSASGNFRVRLPDGAYGNTTTSVRTLELYQNTTGRDAFLTFHSNTDFAAHFGLDAANNDLFYGGWSVGDVKHKVWHAGNDGSGSGLDADLFDGVDSITRSASHRANRALHGGGTITVSAGGSVLWGTRFIVISNGNGSNFSTTGYFDITCPTSGTITGVGGAPNKTATASGIPLSAWESLYYILPIGSGSSSLAANFRVVGYSTALDIPHNWVLICAYNADQNRYYFNNGVFLAPGQSLDTSTYDAYNVALLNGYAVGTSGTAVPLLSGTNTWGATQAFRTITATDVSGAAGATKIVDVLNGTTGVGVVPRAAAGSYNNIVALNDTVIVASNTASVGNSALTLVPWAAAAGGVRIDSKSNRINVEITADRTTITGNATITGAMTVGNVAISLGSLLSSTPASQDVFFSTSRNTGNATKLEISNLRRATGSDWTTAATRIQSAIDTVYMGYIDFNGPGNVNGLSFGAGSGASSNDVPEIMRITSSGKVGIGTKSPTEVLDIVGSAKATGDISAGNDVFATSRMTVGNTARVTGILGTTAVPGFVLAASSTALGEMALSFYGGAADDSSTLKLARTGSGAGSVIGAPAIVSSNDTIGKIIFSASGGGSVVRRAATIYSYVDGTPSDSSMPGRLVFSTTPSGSIIPEERMRIDSEGKISTTGPIITGGINATSIIYNKTKITGLSPQYSNGAQEVGFSVAAQEATSSGLFFKPDGSLMYVVGTTGDNIKQYALATPWDVTSASYSGVSVKLDVNDPNPNDLSFSSDGTYVYVLGNTNGNVAQYSLSSSWNVLSLTSNTSNLVASYNVYASDSAITGLRGLTFSDDGRYMYVTTGTGSTKIAQYSLSTPWNVSTATYFANSGAGSIVNPTGLTSFLASSIQFLNDGSYLLLRDDNSDSICFYTVKEPWNISSSVTLVGNVPIGVNSTGGSGLYAKRDGKLLFTVDGVADSVNVFRSTTNTSSFSVLGDAVINGNLDVSSRVVYNDTVIDRPVRTITASASLSDNVAGKTIVVNSSSPVTLTFTSAAYAGFTVDIIRRGTGNVTIANSASVAKLNVASAQPMSNISALYAAARVTYTATNEFILTGSIQP